MQPAPVAKAKPRAEGIHTLEAPILGCRRGYGSSAGRIIPRHRPGKREKGPIPSLIDQNSCAHWRSPMAMMRQGRSTRRFQPQLLFHPLGVARVVTSVRKVFEAPQHPAGRLDQQEYAPHTFKLSTIS